MTGDGVVGGRGCLSSSSGEVRVLAYHQPHLWRQHKQLSRATADDVLRCSRRGSLTIESFHHSCPPSHTVLLLSTSVVVSTFLWFNTVKMSSGDRKETVEAVPEEVAKLPARKKLPKELQDTLDSEEKMWSVLYEGKAQPSTDSNVRYAAYATRIRTILLAAHRYVAYTSDIGESFRPVAHPILVRSAYGISWAYIGGDVAYEGYKAYLNNQRTLHPDAPVTKDRFGNDKIVKEEAEEKKKEQGSIIVKPGKVPALEDYRTVMAQRAVFQSIASMGLPAFTIHSIVRYSGQAMKNVKNQRLRTWGPIGVSLQ